MEVKTMEPKKLLEKYYSRLAQESFLKSLLWGLVVGFSALLLSAIVCWYVGLIKIFRKWKGVTPKQFKKNHGK